MQMLPSRRTTVVRVRAAACTCALALLVPASSVAAGTHAAAQRDPARQLAQVDSATLEQCVTSVVQSERSATFAAEMTAIAGAPRMAVRIELQERPAGEAAFHRVSAAGLDVWRAADPKVRIYKYLKQVTNLSAPAEYRALVRFRWESAGARVIRRAERMTQHCVQPEPPPSFSAGASSTS
jgi:hypothetical protein